MQLFHCKYFKKLIQPTGNEDLARIAKFVESIADLGALERFFRPEGKMNDRVCALPVIRSKLRLYCLRLSDSILILGNGGVKKTRTYDEDDELRGFVVTLQNFDKHIKEGVKDGTIAISENEIETAQAETPVHEISGQRIFPVGGEGVRSIVLPV